MKRYKFNEDYADFKSGELVCELTKHDFGIPRDDTRISGEPYIAISKDGDYPFSSVPEKVLEEYD